MVTWMNKEQRNQRDFNLWFVEFCQWVKQVYPGQSNWIDIGTSKGDTVATMSLANQSGFVFGFEPDLHAFEICQRRFSDAKNVLIHNVACYKNTESQKYYSGEHLPGYGFIGLSPLLSDKQQAASLTGMQSSMIKPIVLDNEFESNSLPVKLIKVDAESSDFPILQGARQILKQDRPIVIFEFCGDIGTKAHGYTAEEFFNFFDQLNYKLFTAIGGLDKSFIQSHWSQYTEQLKDIIAIPVEIFNEQNI